MAGETVSLDYTAPEPGVDANGNPHESETPLHPGFQAIHQPDAFNPFAPGVWLVRRILTRVTARDAQRGIAEEYHTYPGTYPTLEDAIAAAKTFYEQDGPGDVGGDKALQEHVKSAPASRQDPAPETHEENASA